MYLSEISIKQENPWGYKININHPDIKELFDMFCMHCTRVHCIYYPITDKERFEFENIIYEMLKTSFGDEAQKKWFRQRIGC